MVVKSQRSISELKCKDQSEHTHNKTNMDSEGSTRIKQAVGAWEEN